MVASSAEGGTELWLRVGHDSSLSFLTCSLCAYSWFLLKKEKKNSSDNFPAVPLLGQRHVKGFLALETYHYE